MGKYFFFVYHVYMEQTRYTHNYSRLKQEKVSMPTLIYYVH